jgi:two-component system, NtrC family, sensor kinase
MSTVNFFVKILLLLLLPVLGMTQDSVILISRSDFYKTTDQVFIAMKDGWVFRKGNDKLWSGKDINTSGWEKIKPSEFTGKYADQNGKAEGWFRIKIKMGGDLGNQLTGIKISTWAAFDLYIDGRFISSFGSTGMDGRPYHEFSPYGNLPVAVNLKPGNEYVIALHIVDWISPLPPHRLKSEDLGLNFEIRITGPAYPPYFLRNGVKEPTIYSTIWISVSAILCFLFWFLYFQNPLEKNLRLIALFTTFSAIGIFCQNAGQSTIDLTYNWFLFFNSMAGIFNGLACIMIPIILANIFKRRVNLGLRIFQSAFLTAFVTATIFLSNYAGSVTILSLLGILFALCTYYIMASWQNLKGAQWSIVVGILCTLIWALVYALSIFENSTSSFLFYLSITGYSLSIPIALLVYVSMRFREIIIEVRQHAKQVVLLSEEKKEQALNQQKILQEEVNRQTAELRTTLTNLKATQSQLVQSEKMASLGELMAGIAHEIQNPLNFINNFSEVNAELISEMEQEIDGGNLNDIRTLAKDIQENEQKIGHHGKRADAIVKAMLQHSHNGAGQKELTDINALADEYLRLSYQGFRVKDRAFNSTMRTAFDPTIAKINIVPQDMGRVFLNLFNNAFYTLFEKKKQLGDAYEPKLIVTTKNFDEKVVISVKDNGLGVPKKLLEKIFQPFFTTKPTGQGTGLGLSLSYDIIKAFGGELNVNTQEGEGTEFLIQIPVI